MIIDQKTYFKYFQCLLKGNRRECREIVLSLLENDVDIKSLYVDLFQRALYETGELWAQNQVSVAVEHMATSITESLFPLVYPKIFMAEHTGGKAIISCVANEFHQIGGKMVADILELNGWDTLFLGANTPLLDLMDLINEQQPDQVGLSLSLYSNLPYLLSIIDSIRERYPRLPLFVGGQAFRFGGSEVLSRYEEVTQINSLAELEKYIRRPEYVS